MAWSRAKLFVAIVARFIAVFGVVFRKLPRWFVSTRVRCNSWSLRVLVHRDRNFELSPTFEKYDFIKWRNGVFGVPNNYKCHSLLYRRGKSDVRVQDTEEAILILDKLHTTLDSPLPWLFFNRVTFFTSPKSENMRKIFSSVKWRGMSPTNYLFPGVVIRLNTLDDELLLPDLDVVSGDFDERSSCLFLGGNLRFVPLEPTLEFVSESLVKDSSVCFIILPVWDDSLRSSPEHSESMVACVVKIQSTSVYNIRKLFKTLLPFCSFEVGPPWRNSFVCLSCLLQKH